MNFPSEIYSPNYPKPQLSSLIGSLSSIDWSKKRAKCIETSAEPTFAQDNVLPKLVSNGLTVG